MLIHFVCLNRINGHVYCFKPSFNLSNSIKPLWPATWMCIPGIVSPIVILSLCYSKLENRMPSVFPRSYNITYSYTIYIYHIYIYIICIYVYISTSYSQSFYTFPLFNHSDLGFSHDHPIPSPWTFRLPEGTGRAQEHELKRFLPELASVPLTEEVGTTNWNEGGKGWEELWEKSMKIWQITWDGWKYGCNMGKYGCNMGVIQKMDGFNGENRWD